MRNLPVSISEEDIKSFLISKGLPSGHNDMKISRSKKNKNVDIENISPKTCVALIENIHEKVFFNMKIYCRGLKNLVTPAKDTNIVKTDVPVNSSNKIEELKVDNSNKAEAYREENSTNLETKTVSVTDDKNTGMKPKTPSFSLSKAKL